MPRGIAEHLVVDGHIVQFCRQCKRMIFVEREIVYVTARTRKNPHAGRIAWQRDGICRECYRKEEATQ